MGRGTPLKLLVATNNPGKVREYRELLAGLPLELTWLGELGLDLHVEESGETFRENAVLKATACAQATRPRPVPRPAVS